MYTVKVQGTALSKRLGTQVGATWVQEPHGSLPAVYLQLRFPTCNEEQELLLPGEGQSV